MTIEAPDFLIVNAVRYAIGRRSVVTSDTADWLRANWSSLPDAVQAWIRSDVEEAFKRDDLGDDCDRREWEKVRELWSTKG